MKPGGGRGVYTLVRAVSRPGRAKAMATGPCGRSAWKEVTMTRRIPRSILQGALALALGVGAVTAFAAPAAAGRDDHLGGGVYFSTGPSYYYAPPPTYYYAPPTYYYPRTYYYTPRTYYYAPPPAYYYEPSFSFGIRV